MNLWPLGCYILHALKALFQHQAMSVRAVTSLLQLMKLTYNLESGLKLLFTKWGLLFTQIRNY